jgi:hypothetical protein
LNDRPRKCLGYFSANELLLINRGCSAWGVRRGLLSNSITTTKESICKHY